MAYFVIMAGGSGTRFWPRSREQRPKQLIRVTGEHTLLQHTVLRLVPEVPAERVMIITRGDHSAETAQQLADHPGIQVVGEPQGRDTAACIGLAATLIARKDPDAVMAVTPADHLIEPAERFRAAVEQAERVAREKHCFVTLGIKPREPATRFGYIERAEPLGAPGPFQAYGVAAFREKPDEETAKSFLESGRFYWNSGTFIWRVQDVLDGIEAHMPALHAGLQRIAEALGTTEEAEVIAREYEQLEKISIDYGVMEKAGNTVVLEVDYMWDDVGAWDAIPRLHGSDDAGNTAEGPTHLLDTKNCIVVTEGAHLVSTVGVEDLVIVHSHDATLVCRRDRIGDVKSLVTRLREDGFEDYL